MLGTSTKKNVAPQPFNVPATSSVAVVSPDGVFGTIPSDEIAAATDSGYRLDTPEVRKDIENQKKYGEGFGNEAAAFGLGAARTLSFGLSDLALKNSGMVSAERLRETKERNPNASLAGEIGGFAVPLVGHALGAIEGAGAVAKGVGLGARLSGSGISGVTAIGQSIAKEIARATGSEIIGSAAQVAAESFAYNIAQNLSESVLGEKEITAQRLLANSGQALALGAGLGFGIPLAGKAVVAAATKAKQALDAFGNAMTERILPAAAEKFAQGYSKTYGSVTGKGQAAADEVYAMVSGSFTKEGAAKQAEIVKAISPDANDEIIRTFTQQLGDVHSTTKKAVDIAFKNMRPKEVERLLADVDVRPASEDLQRLIGAIREKAKKIKAGTINYDGSYVGDLIGIADDLEKKLMGDGLATAEQVYHVVNDVKKVALSDLAGFGKAPPSSHAAEKTVKEIRDVYKEFAAHLENPKLYGDAAARQSAINEAFSTYQRTLDKGENNFRRFFLTNGELDSKKVTNYLRQIETGRAIDGTAALQEYQQAARAMVEQAELSAAGAGATAEFHGVGHIGGGIDRAGFEGLARNLVDTQLKAANDLAFTNKIRQQDMLGTAFLRFQETFGANFMNSGAFSATINLAKKAASPFGVVKSLSFANGLVMDSGKRAANTIGRMIGRFGDATSKAAIAMRPYVEPASLHALLGNVMGEEDEKKTTDRIESFDRSSMRLAALVADPGGTAAKLGAGFHTLAPHAPELTQAAVETQMRGIAFLDAKAPKRDAHTLNPFVDPWQPSDGELSTWERYAAAVQDPLGVLDDIEHGHASPEGVEALQAVYPALYEDLKTQLVTRVAEMQTAVPYRDRLQLSLLFGVALDPTLEPSFVNAVQNGYGEAASQAQESRPASRPHSASKTGAIEETTAQRIARR